MTYKELETKINNILNDESITDKAKTIVSYIKVIEYSTTIFDVTLLPIADAEGVPVDNSERHISVYGDELTNDGDNYVILKDKEIVFQCPSSLVMSASRR